MKCLWDRVYVEWQDAVHDGVWSNAEDEQHQILVVCQTTGWLIHQDKSRMAIASTIHQIGRQVANKQYIPIKMITRFKVLERGVKRGKRG